MADRYEATRTVLDAHSLNIAAHVSAGCLALGLGFAILATQKGSPRHRRWGRLFGYATLLVCAFAAIGLACFRFMPLFAVLTVLVTYQLLGGWRSVYTKERGPSGFDAALTGVAVALSAWLAMALLRQELGASVVVRSTLGALAALLAYDTLRFAFPRRWYSHLWRYEHSFKMVSSLFAMVSALVGNTVRSGQPWSQLMPSVMGLVFVAYFFVRLRQQDLRSTL